MKLDPLSIPYRVVEHSLRIAGPIVVLGIAGMGGDLVVGAGIFITLVIFGVGLLSVWEVAYHRRFRYELTEDTFDIHSGVLSRRQREIPYHRIQNVDIAQNVVQRVGSIAEVRLETAGGGQTEAHLRYVKRREAERLQDELGRHKDRSPGSGDEPAQTTLFSITPRELGILGVVSMDLRLLPLLVVGLSVFGPAAVSRAIPEIDQLFLVGPLVGVSTILLVGLFSGAISVLRYYDFTLRSVGDQYRYERGLLQRFSGSIPVEKVQTLSIRETVLARVLGYASLTIETAGYAPGQGGESGTRSQSAIPIADRERVFDLARSIEPFGDVSFERPPKRARERYAVRYGLVAVGIILLAYGVNAVFNLEAPWYLAAVVLPVVPIGAHYKWLNRGYYLGEEYVITRNGFWSRRITVVPAYRIQTVVHSRTIFQRRRNLASVVIDTAGSSSLIGDDAIAADIDDTAGDRLQEASEAMLQDALGTRA